MDQEIKKKLFSLCQETVRLKIEDLQSSLKDLEEAGSESTKSSAGDKYETETAMLHLEREKFEQQLTDALRLRSALENIPRHINHQKVQPGSVVKTNHGNFFISIFAGKLEVDGESYFAISLASPIGKALEAASIGDVVEFRDKKYVVEDLG